MSGTIGNKIKMSIFGQSHANAIGVVIDGLEAGLKIDEEQLQNFLDRRSPGKDEFSTIRKEPDKVEFLSGLVNGKTCGAPICAIIKNTNVKKNDYKNFENIPRPGHADFTSFIKFGESMDKSGGAQFSGRMTAPMCIAGGIAMQQLKILGIDIIARIDEIAGVKGASMFNKITEAKKEGDSVGGVIKCEITGMPKGIGDALFGGIEGRISQSIFGIPAVKGIEFGSGFEGSQKRGSCNNDDFIAVDDEIKTVTNNHGGILGGISSGMPIVFRVAFKPTPSISRLQRSVNLKTNECVDIEINGRHDPCIVPRAVPVVEAMAAFAIYDMICE